MIYITKTEIAPDKNAVNPCLLINLEFEFDRYYELPIGFSGRLKTQDGTRLSYIQSEKDQNFQYTLRDNGLTIDQSKTKHDRSKFTKQLSTELTNNAIDRIELIRIADPKKEISLTVEIDVTTLKIENNQSQITQLKAEITQTQIIYTIPQSKWIQDFAPHLGIGNYLLIEFPINPTDIEINKLNSWGDKLGRARKRLEEMQNYLALGEWEKVIEASRKVWEIFKLKEKEVVLKSELKSLLYLNNYSEEGLDNLLTSIWNMHEYASKFVHEKDKEGSLKPELYAKKEDAYFIYMWAIGLVNMLSEKLKNEVVR